MIELETALSIGQPMLSQQLNFLRPEGLVSTQREGKQIFYNITSREVTAVIQVMYEQFCRKQKGKKNDH